MIVDQAPAPSPQSGERVADAEAVFAARTPWTAGAATFFALIAMVFASGLAVLAGTVYFKLGIWWRGGSNIASEHVTLTNTMLATAVLQIAALAAVWWGASRFGGQRWQVLSLAEPLPRRALLLGLGGMLAILAPINLVTYLVWPDDFATDLRPYADLVRSPALWLGVLVIVIGAPLWEELLFRGFLLPALTKTRWGFLGAAFMTTFAWTALHLNYTFASLVEVMLIGFYFCWLMWRFGNLRLPIVLHALYNGLQLAVLMAWPNVLAGG